MTCPACGKESTGRFCANCGKVLDGKAPMTLTLPWALALAAGAGFLVLLIVVLARQEPGRPSPSDVSAAPAAAPPDISNMSPRERFDRLRGTPHEFVARTRSYILRMAVDTPFREEDVAAGHCERSGSP